MSNTVLVLNGPSLGLLGQRQPEVYGSTTLEELAGTLKEKGAELGFDIDFRQSDDEGTLISWILQARGAVAGVILNPGALTHYSLALRDAIVASELLVVEVHISNIHAREEWRSRSVISDVASGVIAGLGVHGYVLALQDLKRRAESGG